MKNMQKLSLAFLILFTVGLQAKAQDAISDLLKGSQEDAQYLAEGYVDSFLKATGSGINQGWYNTAKNHKFPGFDFTFSVALIAIPDDEKFYTVENSKMNDLELYQLADGTTVTGGSGKVPSLVGPDASPVYRYKAGHPLAGQTFEGPKGLDINVLNRSAALPVYNLGIGLPKGIDLKIRWSPTLDLGSLGVGIEGEAKIFGIGVMHDIKQYIPGIKMLPFDLAAMIAFSKMEISTELDNPDQRAEFNIQGTTFQAIISKKISVITPYAALGFSTSKASAKALGEYDFGGATTIKDPINVESKLSGARLTAGLRLQLLVLSFHCDYTLQKYDTVTAGIGLTVR